MSGFNESEQVSKIMELRPLDTSWDDFFKSIDPNIHDWYASTEQELLPLIDSDERVHTAVDQMNQRIYMMFKIHVARELVQQGAAFDMSVADVLKIFESRHNKKLFSEFADEQIRVLNTMELKLLSLLTEVLGESGIYDQKTRAKKKIVSTEKGNLDHFGCPGMSPLFMINIMENNGDPKPTLREKMFIPYRYLFSDFVLQHLNDNNFIDDANNVLRSLAQEWEIDKEFIFKVCGTDKLTTENFGVFIRSCFSGFTRDQKIRISKESHEKTGVELLEPSARERMTYGDLTSARALIWTQATAQNRFAFNPNAPAHQYADLMSKFSQESDIGTYFYSGPSGMTDTILTMLRCFGLGDPNYLMDIRAALIQTMITPKDHGLIEIGFSSKGLQLPFTLSSRDEMLRSLFSQNPTLLKKILHQERPKE